MREGREEGGEARGGEREEKGKGKEERKKKKGRKEISAISISMSPAE